MLRLKLLKPTSFARTLDQTALVLLAAVVLVNVYRQQYLDTADPYKCTALLTQGHWLDSPNRNPHFRPFHNWHVPGCLLHNYTAPDVASCNEDGQVLFVGDTGTRQVFWAAARKIEGNSMWVYNKQAERDMHGDLEYSTQGASLKFMWDPWLNSTALKQELKMFKERNEALSKPDSFTSKTVSTVDTKRRRSVLILVGGGLFHARHLGDEYLTHFRRSVDAVAAASATKLGPHGTKAVGKDGLGDQIFFAPVIEPLFDRLSPSREATITPHKIQAMNAYLQDQSLRGLKVPWSYHNMTKKWPELVGMSGIHVNARVASKMADIVLNYRCNAKMVQREGYPHNRTCCSPYRRLNWIQIMVAILLFPCSRIDFRMRRLTKPGSTSFFMGRTPGMRAIWPIALVIYYSYIADRTHLLDKSPKEFANSDFNVILGIAVLVSMINIKKTPASPKSGCGTRPPRRLPQYPFLPRVQSDEFKGWLQIYILAYRYTGASGVLNFYEVYRIFVAACLFLSGYGHTMYFLRTKDYTLQRVVSVLFRRNTLPVILAFTMNRPYGSYFFAPLVSVWFLVIYATLRLGQRYNESFWYLIGKIGISALLVTGYTRTRGMIELTTTCLRLLFQANVNENEWRFHLGIDKYVVLVGMIVAVLRIRIASVLKTPRRQIQIRSTARMRLYAIIAHVVIVALALVVLPGFWILTRRSPNKADYDWWMPYIAWLPIVSFLVLRNSTHFLRSYYCVSFAWLGRISLELHLLSYHIWLAGDGKGLLRVGFRSSDRGFFSYGWLSMVILTPIFVWLAWKVHSATEEIIDWILCTKSAPKPIGLGIEGLGEQQDEEHRDDTLLTPIGQIAQAPDSQSENIGLSASITRRLVFVAAVVWLASLFNI